MVSELLYAGKTLREVAGLDDMQMLYVLFRPRDQYGRLKSRVYSGLPKGVEVDADGMRIVSKPVSYTAMFHQVMRKRYGREKTLAKWQEFLKDNPSFRKLQGEE